MMIFKIENLFGIKNAIQICTVFLGCVFLCSCGSQRLKIPFMDYHPHYLFDSEETSKPLSPVCAEAGWEYLQRTTANILAGEDPYYNLRQAQDFFDQCYIADKYNYNAEWGWAIIHGEEALCAERHWIEPNIRRSKSELKILLRGDDVPAEERPRVELDLANACNGLGIALKIEDPEESRENLLEAQEILERLIKEDPENGNIYRIYSFNAFYREDYEKADEYRKKAESFGVTFTKFYLWDLEQHLQGIQSCDSEPQK